jgi:hypothetical protein
MKLNKFVIPAGALMVALATTGLPAEAGQRDSRGRDRNGRQSQGETRGRSSGRSDAGRVQQRSDSGSRGAESARGSSGNIYSRGSASPSRDTAGPNRGSASPNRDTAGPNRGSASPNRGTAGPNRSSAGPSRGNDVRGANDPGRDNRGGSYRGGTAPNRAVPRAVVPDRRNDNRNAYRYDNRSYQYNNRNNRNYRYDTYRGRPRIYAAPRYIPVPSRPRHYYGSGGHLSVYFGWGNGYLYGTPWSGRVYGYIAPQVYGARIYYGDVRLQVRPRDAAVYVDGYYAGIVDDFDGVFQRLTLQAGPHQIELSAPGLEPQFFDVYVDPVQTVNIRTDLFR